MACQLEHKISVETFKSLRPIISLPPTVTFQSKDEFPLFKFTILTYNILAQDHIHRTAYPYCAKASLRWSHRRTLFASEFEAYNSDIACFQEMDRFHDYFQPLLRRLGYEERYILRNGPRSDTNCVVWKRDKFSLIGEKQVSFEHTTAGMGSVPNVAQFVALQSKTVPGIRLIVATTHLYWRVECDHIRLIQMHCLVKAVVEWKAELEFEALEGGGQDYLIFIAGDLNSDRESMAVQAALRSGFLLDQDQFNSMLEKAQLPAQDLRNILSDFTIKWPKFYDAYSNYASAVPGPNGYDLPYTTFCLYKGILDFILYSAFNSNNGLLRVIPTALLMIPERGVLEDEVALPNSIFPSDHLALQAEFTIFQNKT